MYRFRWLAILVGSIISASAWGQQDMTLLSSATVARGQTDAAIALLESLYPYDVIVTIEETIDVGDRIIPSATRKWRLRMNLDEEICLFAVDARSISFEDAMADRHDNWTSRSSFVEIKGKSVTSMRVKHPVQRRETAYFQAGVISERIPDLPQCVHVDILSAAANTGRQKEYIPRIFSMAEEFIVQEGIRDEDPVVDVKAVIVSRGIEEVHRWVYSVGTLEPKVYQILQSPIGSPAVKSLYRHNLEWADDENYGRVPVAAQVVQSVSMRMQENDGETKRLKCERHSNITFVWKKYGKTDEVLDSNGQMLAPKLESLFE